jgi:hypothetical protein
VELALGSSAQDVTRQLESPYLAWSLPPGQQPRLPVAQARPSPRRLDILRRGQRIGFWRRQRSDFGRGPLSEYGRMMRAAMLTPWFAVGVGIVVATSMTLVTPHPALTFPPPKNGPTTPQYGPAPAINREVRLSEPTGYVVNVKVKYKLLPRRHHGFAAVIVVQGDHRLGDWKLRFRLPGATIKQVIWAGWRHDGQDVVVTGSPPAWHIDAKVTRIVVFGTGIPRSPTRCEFDGGTCSFRSLTE